ncbi:MAG TPA: tRNA (adenosine(37)-N6)-dimethylallyltransferase MiaA [Candidatus Paceibacterota bacterium]
MQKILVILGPTASGKSDLAVKIAKKYNGEVISADSRQVYKGLNIGTGKITKKEMRGVHHWLLDIVSPKKTFNVADFKKLAAGKIQTILKRHKLPIICGGTGFYIDSFVKNISLPEVKPNKKLRKELENKSLEELVKILEKLDKDRLQNIDQKNRVRLIRAIEIANAIGKVPEIKKENSKYHFLQIGLEIPKDEMVARINKRLEKRIKLGMIEEAENLHKKGLPLERMRELGLEYRFLADYLDKKISKDKLSEKLKTEIWRYSRRQITWFKRDKNIKWFKPKEFSKINAEVKNFLTGK